MDNICVFNRKQVPVVLVSIIMILIMVGSTINVASNEGMTEDMTYSMGLFFREIGDQSSSEQTIPNPFSGYIKEILLAEGLLSFEVEDVSNSLIEFEVLSPYNMVVLGEMTLDKEEIKELNDYVKNGGKLITFRPPIGLAEEFGLISQDRTIRRGTVKMANLPWVWPSLIDKDVQFYGTADVYSSEGVDVLSWMKSGPQEIPGAMHIKYGEGEVVVFAYDLGMSTVRARQGDPDYSSTGRYPDSTRDGAFKADDLFTAQLRQDKLEIPQADIAQRHLINIIQMLAETSIPLPRMWYFPDGAPSTVLLTGDSDAMTLEDLARTTNIVKDNGGVFTTYLWDQDWGRVPPTVVNRLLEQGHGFGVHGWAGTSMPSVTQMERALRRQQNQFIERYGYNPLTYRGHVLTWVGWTEMAKLLYSVGVRMEMNFVATYKYGYINGSGLPMRFMDEKGEYIDVYQQGTQFEDDCVLFGYYGFEGLTVNEAIAESRRLMDESKKLYHGVMNFNFHPIYIGSRGNAAPWLDDVSAYARDIGIPMLHADKWVHFNDARRTIAINDISMSDSTMTFNIKKGEYAEGLTLVFPKMWNGLKVVGVSVDGISTLFDIINVYGGIKLAWITLDGLAASEGEVSIVYE